MNMPVRLAISVLSISVLGPAQAQRCEAISGPQQVRLVELYTSEGCNSCPPADQWLSTLQRRPDVLAVAFHVDYWDRLGWVDRFGSAAHTQRQAEQQRTSGAGFSYTPQVLVDGRDWRRWPALPAAHGAARVNIMLRRQGDGRVDAQVEPLAGVPLRLGAWWAAVEDGHVSVVKAGENNGATLHHDHVVRSYTTLPAWPAGVRRWSLDAPQRGEGGRPRRLLFVVTDADSGTPLQAAQLTC